MKMLAHLSDAALRCELIAAVARDRASTAELLAHIAEFDARKLYVPEGYSSMHVYCVEELHLSEDAAYKRIQAARAARQFPVLLKALADGRLHLAAVCLLAPHLTAENSGELIGAAARRAGIHQPGIGSVRRDHLGGMIGSPPMRTTLGRIAVRAVRARSEGSAGHWPRMGRCRDADRCNHLCLELKPAAPGLYTDADPTDARNSGRRLPRAGPT